MHIEQRQAFSEVVAEHAGKLTGREIDESLNAAALEFVGEPVAEIAFDLWPALRPHCVRGRILRVGAAEHAAVAAEFFGIVEREIKLVGEPERQASSGLRLLRQQWKEQFGARGD